MICRPTTFFIIYKTFFALRRYLRRNLRCIAKFVITLALKFKFALQILLVYEVKLVFLTFVKITLLHRLIYCFIIDTKSVQIIDKTKGARSRTRKTGGKRKVTYASLDNIFAKMYSVLISRIYTLLHSIKLGTKFTNVFGC